ncbi:winged helix-turn-helix domain-containing protein [Phytohabitans sp. ZYX-F-186]|uniref:Winged helix-turn-helix domain-containing protein n=1 Tax=Phytohabitans maris TaxID=3071409 RepID=A0ABU0ZD05_9ACTN|nr:winged helix-turn-helix domain-containing protein [Phytohabitans sp. ZYX-F-186]MDQ7904918.1 winged helix-turn-helix domain-containing protein [Phytohabitans sp. ZYX-F-186]
MSGDLAVPLIIGIAPSAAARRRLAQLLGGTEAFLIVASVEQAREFLDAAVPRTTTQAPASGAAPVEREPEAPRPPDLSVDSDRRVLRWLDREVELTRLEHDFLHRLLDAPGQVFTYERLHLEVWGNQHLGRGSDIHSVVRRVRRKLAGLEAAATIHSVRGVGFRLTAA